MISFNSRSYNSSGSFRPKPLVHEDESQGLYVFLTSWGEPQVAQDVLQTFLTQIQQSYDDDYTRVGGSAPVDRESRVHAKPWKELIDPWVQTAHKALLQKRQPSAVEFLALKIDGSKVSWAQLGQPNLLLARRGRFSFLSVQPDFGLLDPSSPPIPRACLGGLGGVSLSVSFGETQLQQGDKLICLARSWDPVWQRFQQQIDFAEIAKFLIEDEPQQAFWLGCLDLS